MGIDFAALVGPARSWGWARSPATGGRDPSPPALSHGMNLDALSGTLILADWKARQRFATLGFPVGVELGAANAASCPLVRAADLTR